MGGRRGYAGLALGLGLLGMVLGFAGGIGFGMTGAWLGISLGSLAFVFGALTRRLPQGKGIGGMVTGILAIGCSVLALGFLTMISDAAAELSDRAPILASFSEDIKEGFYHLAKKVDESEIDWDALEAELDAMQKKDGAETE